MYIFGGRMDLGGTRFTGENFYLNDLYSFNVRTKHWTQIIPDQTYLFLNQSEHQSQFSPCGRRSHSAVVHNGKIILFGGFQENIQKHFDDIYEFNPAKSEWKVLETSGNIPSQRRRHCCVVVNNQMFIFGGTGPREPNAEPRQNQNAIEQMEGNQVNHF
jgi:N-acetylneuraminic acid mutarotase